MELLIVLGFQFALIIFLEIRNYIQVKTLTDRLYAKSYQEYILSEVEKKNALKHVPDKHKDYLNI